MLTLVLDAGNTSLKGRWYNNGKPAGSVVKLINNELFSCSNPANALTTALLQNIPEHAPFETVCSCVSKQIRNLLEQAFLYDLPPMHPLQRSNYSICNYSTCNSTSRSTCGDRPSACASASNADRDNLQTTCTKLFFLESKDFPERTSYYHPQEMGIDRMAAAAAASQLYPDMPLIVIDCGSATTLDAVSCNGKILGGTILPGMETMLKGLLQSAPHLPTVPLTAPAAAAGRSTAECLQSGIFYAAVGACREIINKLTKECFPDISPVVIATGGYAPLLYNQNIFSILEPELVLAGTALLAGICW